MTKPLEPNSHGYFFEEHRTLLKLMVKHNVRFMLIGGYAVAHYGYERTTADMDVWLQVSDENKTHFIKALQDFGITNEGLEYFEEIDFKKTISCFSLWSKTPQD